MKTKKPKAKAKKYGKWLTRGIWNCGCTLLRWRWQMPSRAKKCHDCSYHRPKAGLVCSVADFRADGVDLPEVRNGEQSFHAIVL